MFIPIRDIMSTDLVTVKPETKARDIIHLFQKHDFHHLPVVKGRKVMGIISKLDLLDFFEDMSTWVDNRDQTKYLVENTVASELMTKDPVTVKPDDSVEFAIGIFRENFFHSLPVVDKGKLVGILTTYDVLCNAFKPNFIDVP
ncbi:MAG: CBS domain-containing protein [Saprospiraceae bacterium]|nr:CBS domain-containing protein [Saprospiraceae bacterium]